MLSVRERWSLVPKLAGKNDSDYHKKDGCCEANQDKKLEAPDTTEQKISRGLRPEMDVDFEKLRPLSVYDEHGNVVRFVELFLNQKTIVIFTRHFLDFVTKEYVEDLAIIPPNYFQKADVRLVVIGPSPYKFIKSFKTVTNYHYSLYCDPERQVYEALGLSEKVAIGQLKHSKHVKSGAFMGLLKSVWRAMESKEYQGNTRQQGGSFILGPGEQVHFYHQDQNCADHMNINDLLMEAGVQSVSFPKDQRVFTI